MMIRRRLLHSLQCFKISPPLGEIGALRQLQTAAPIVASQHENGYRYGWGVGLLASLGVVASIGVAHAQGNIPHPEEGKGWNLIGLDQRRKAFFKYEKRIRELSPPEKVFEYFASQGSIQQGFSMTPSDMMRSAVPVYPPAGSDILRAGSLPGEPSPHMPDTKKGLSSSFLKVFDVDNSGGVTFDEWLVFQSLLAIPDDDVEVAFMLVDTDSSGKIDKEEFMHLLASIQGRAVKPTATLRKSVGNLNAADSGLITMFFGKNGKGEITLNDFRSFVRQLREELVKLEFEHYDYDNSGSISASDLAHSIAGSARLKHIDDYMSKIDDMPEALAKEQVTLNEFATFRSAWRRLRQLAVALEFWKSSRGHVMPDDFKLIAARVLNVDLSQTVLDVLYYLFAREDGSLKINYMYAVMDRHSETGMTVNYEHMKSSTEQGFLACMQKCAASKA